MKYDALVATAESSGELPPGGETLVYGGVQIEKYAIKKGTVLISHCHVYDHPSILAAGSVELWTPTGVERLTGPIEVKIAAGVKHALKALTDAVWYCIHVG